MSNWKNIKTKNKFKTMKKKRIYLTQCFQQKKSKNIIEDKVVFKQEI